MRARSRSLAGVIAAVAVTAGIACQSGTQSTGSHTRQVRTQDGKPDFTGIWQANNEAYWGLQAHSARAGIVTQPGVSPYESSAVAAAPFVALGAAAGVPASMGVVEGDGEIPYKPEAAAVRRENA